MCAGMHGQTLYMAETLLLHDELLEDQAIKLVDLETGVVTYLQSSPGTILALDSVTSMSLVDAGSHSSLMVLCAPGGYGPDLLYLCFSRLPLASLEHGRGSGFWRGACAGFRVLGSTPFVSPTGRWMLGDEVPGQWALFHVHEGNLEVLVAIACQTNSNRLAQ